MFGFHTTPIEDDELDQAGKVVKTVPRLEVGDVIFSDQKKKLRGRVAEAEQFRGVDRIRRRRPLELHFVQLKPRLALKRSLQHFQTNLGRRQLPVDFVGRSRRGNEEEPVEPECFNRLLSQDQMPVMDRIECSTKDANSFQDFTSGDGRAN